MSNNQVIPEAAVEAAALAMLATPGDYPGEDRALDWAKVMSRAALEAAAPHMPSTTSRGQNMTAKQIAQDIRTTPVPGPFSLAEPIADHLYKLGYRKTTK